MFNENHQITNKIMGGGKTKTNEQLSEWNTLKKMITFIMFARLSRCKRKYRK